MSSIWNVRVRAFIPDSASYNPIHIISKSMFFTMKNSKIEIVSRPGDDEFFAGNRDGL